MDGREKRLALVPPAETPAVPTRSDDDLMLLARGGAGGAFDELVRRHQARVLGVAARSLGGSALAADVAQNAFVQIYRALPAYQPRGKFTSYLYRVLLNECRMAQRAARRERTQLAAPVVADGEAGEAHILARERQRRVQAALDRLSDKLRAVVLLRYSGALGYEEIADTLGLPVGTVKRRLFDAMEKLRVILTAEEP